MRKLSKSFAVNVTSLPEIRTSVDVEVMRLREEEDARRLGRGIFPAYLVNSILCWYFSRPKGVRNEVVAEGATILDRHLAKSLDLWETGEPDGPSAPEGGELTAGRAGRRGRLGSVESEQIAPGPVGDPPGDDPAIKPRKPPAGGARKGR